MNHDDDPIERGARAAGPGAAPADAVLLVLLMAIAYSLDWIGRCLCRVVCRTHRQAHSDRTDL